MPSLCQIPPSGVAASPASAPTAGTYTSKPTTKAQAQASLKGWTCHGTSCYKVVSATSSTAAQAQCKGMGFNLASVHSRSENTFIKNLCAPHSTTTL